MKPALINMKLVGDVIRKNELYQNAQERFSACADLGGKKYYNKLKRLHGEILQYHRDWEEVRARSRRDIVY